MRALGTRAGLHVDMDKTGFDPRALMERAIEVMKASVGEPRDEGRAVLKVGAVLWKSDGTVDTACRGELRFGDHAEYTLLDKKNYTQRLDGAVLFTTLEPCAPNSRHYPNRSCAERIVNARIRQVWVGIEDPDPKVDRKGIKHLQDCGVEIHIFDRDLQEIINLENKDWLARALERAEAAKEAKEPKAIVLSELESPLATVATEDFSTEALEKYRTAAGIAEPVSSDRFNRRLVQQGLLSQENGPLVPTGFGMLLFGRKPRVAFPQAGLLGTIHYPDGKKETRDFDGPMVLIPPEVEQWLLDKLPSVIDRSTMLRQKVPSLPFEMVRETVVNALIHRTYDIRGAKCQLVITTDTITVKSPGGPLPPITLEQLRAFNAPMLSRNPELHYVFGRMGMAEERGLGMWSLKNRAEELGLPLPRYEWEDPYLVLTLFRNLEAVVKTLKPSVLKLLTDSERKGWQWLATKGRAKSGQYAKAMQMDGRTARRHLNRFLELGLVEKRGSGPSIDYEVI